MAVPFQNTHSARLVAPSGAPASERCVGRSYATPYLAGLVDLLTAAEHSSHYSGVIEELRSLANGAIHIDIGTGCSASGVELFSSFLRKSLPDGTLQYSGPKMTMMTEPDKNNYDALCAEVRDKSFPIPTCILQRAASCVLSQISAYSAEKSVGPKMLITIGGLDEIVIDSNRKSEEIAKAMANLALKREDLTVILYCSRSDLFPSSDALELFPGCLLFSGGLHKEPKRFARPKDVSVVWDNRTTLALAS